MQFLVEEALVARLDRADLDEAAEQHKLDAVAAAERRAAETAKANRGRV